MVTRNHAAPKSLHAFANSDSVRWSRQSARPLSVPSLDFLHEADECVDALFGKRVVDRRTHPPDRPVTLQAIETRGGGFTDETILEFLVGQPECHVHHRTIR